MGFSGQTDRIDSASHLDSMGESGRLDSQVGAALREELREGKITSFSKEEAKALLLGLLVAADADGIDMGREILKKHAYDEVMIAQIIGWSADLSDYTSAKKLALVDLSLSWLRRMSRAEATEFVAASQAMIEADGEVNLFEFMLQNVIRRHVEIGLGLKPVPRIKYRKLLDLRKEVGTLLGAFGELTGERVSLDSASVEYREHTGQELVIGSVGLVNVADALVEMDCATPLVKQQILRMCALVATDDGEVEESEIELLRATAEAIGAPIPPMVRVIS
jgi:hypothetical protein